MMVTYSVPIVYENELMGVITNASREIAEIIGAIENIASKPNLLSLNAAIEAASSLKLYRLLEAVRDSSEHQASSMEEVTKGIEQISEVVQSNSAMAEERSGTSEELSARPMS